MTTPSTTSAPYCTLAVTDALPVSVNVHVRVLVPPLEQAPDQIASRRGGTGPTKLAQTGWLSRMEMEGRGGESGQSERPHL